VAQADGPRRGKGVVIAGRRGPRPKPALATCSAARSAEAGAEVVIEEFMEGEEVSFFALTDGATIVAFGSAQGPQARR
jgi:phosphoribosylamine--glycine ligase